MTQFIPLIIGVAIFRTFVHFANEQDRRQNRALDRQRLILIKYSEREWHDRKSHEREWHEYRQRRQAESMRLFFHTSMN